jgi:hypothetical protein
MKHGGASLYLAAQENGCHVWLGVGTDEALHLLGRALTQCTAQHVTANEVRVQHLHESASTALGEKTADTA